MNKNLGRGAKTSNMGYTCKVQKKTRLMLKKLTNFSCEIEVCQNNVNKMTIFLVKLKSVQIMHIKVTNFD